MSTPVTFAVDLNNLLHATSYGEGTTSSKMQWDGAPFCVAEYIEREVYSRWKETKRIYLVADPLRSDNTRERVQIPFMEKVEDLISKWFAEEDMKVDIRKIIPPFPTDEEIKDHGCGQNCNPVCDKCHSVMSPADVMIMYLHTRHKMESSNSDFIIISNDRFTDNKFLYSYALEKYGSMDVGNAQEVIGEYHQLRRSGDDLTTGIEFSRQISSSKAIEPEMRSDFDFWKETKITDSYPFTSPLREVSMKSTNSPSTKKEMTSYSPIVARWLHKENRPHPYRIKNKNKIKIYRSTGDKIE
jgi:hypothetical protein